MWDDEPMRSSIFRLCGSSSRPDLTPNKHDSTASLRLFVSWSNSLRLPLAD